MYNLKPMEMRYIVPVAAMISAGKSNLLNVLYNIDLLECKAGIGTKFVNILRYNPNIKEPRFFHLIVIKKGEKYIFYKDNSERVIVGKQRIIEAIKYLNKSLAKEKYVNYEKLFYMTEINESPFITNKEYLLNHDLCDIPGLSEYQEAENPDGGEEPYRDQNSDNEGPESEIEIGNFNHLEGKTVEEELKEIKTLNSEHDNMQESGQKMEDDIYYNVELEKNSYINEIFKIIKDYIDGGIIILSVENYYFNQNYEMIALLKKVIKKEINNFLIILNKIDLSKNQEEDAEKCRNLFIQKFPDGKTFNINSNTFIPLSANQLKNELLLRNDFKHLLYYHFQNFINKIKKDEKSIIPKTFIDHLRDIIKTMREISKKEIKKYIYESKIINNKEIIKIINDIENEFKGEEIIFGIDEDDFEEVFDDDEDEHDNNDNISDVIDRINPSYIVKLIYIFHKENKLIPPLSKESQALLNYFNKQNDIINDLPKFENKKEINLFKINAANNIQMLINKEIMEELMKVTKEIENSKFSGIEIKNIMKELYLTIYYLKVYNVIFIPFIGPSNGGKSTIINNIIGEEILECGQKECTKRGIIIGYKDDKEPDITLRKANFKFKEFSGQKNYYFESENYIFASGLKNVKNTIKGLNYAFPDKEENSFYFIKTRIKLFDDLGFDDNLKKMVYLIDFPGFGTGNIFEKKLFKKVMNICNAFIFVVRNSVIKEKEKKEMLDKLFIKSMMNKEKLPSGFIKSCLFVFNNDNKQNTTEEDLIIAKEDIRSIIKRIPDEDNINACFFNAKYYQKYQNNFNYFYNIYQTIIGSYNNYKNFSQEKYIDPEKFNRRLFSNFGEYLHKILDDKIRSLKLGKIKKFVPNKYVEKEVNETIKILEKYGCIAPNEVNIRIKSSISQIFTHARENIKEIQEFKESNFEEFKKTFLEQIIYINDEIQTELFDKINKVITALNYFFNSNFSERQNDLKLFKEFKKNIKITKNDLENLSKDRTKLIESEKEKYVNNIKTLIDERKNKIKIVLETKDWKEYLEEIIKEIKSITEKFAQKIEKIIKDIDTESNKLKYETKKFFESITEGKMEFKDDKNFESFFSEKVSKKGANISNEIIDGINICTENGLSKIWECRTLFVFIKSIFFRVTYLTNLLEIINEDLNDKIGYIVYLLKENFKKYIDSIINFIDLRTKIISTKYTKFQKNEWYNLCKMYEVSKHKIQGNLKKIKQIKYS